MKFKEGDRVEVLRSKAEQYGSWFPAKITSLNGYSFTVRYELFHTSDGKPVVETVHEGDVRPSPPPQDRRELRWVVGGIAEVLDLCAWRVGKVMKVIKEDRIVIKLFGSIQLQEHGVSDLRVPQAWQNNQWLMIDMGIKGKQFGYDYIPSSSNSARKLDCGTSQGIDKQASPGQRSKQKRASCNSPVKAGKRNLNSHCGFSPVNLVGRTKRKRKSSTDKSNKLSRRSLPKKVDCVSFSKDIVAEHFLHKSNKDRTTTFPQMNADKGFTNNRIVNSSSIPLAVTEENIECSVASCSGNEYPGYSYQNLREHRKDTASDSFDDAISSCPIEGKEYQSKSGDELAASVHELELKAYQYTMQALHASGPLSWEQESLLTNLRLSLNISNEEHLLHLRHLAVEYVSSGMVLGLGTGSTAAFVVAEIGALLSSGKLSDIVGVPTSKRTYEQALSLGIPLSTLDAHPRIDLAIDGADEVDPDLNLVKGRGGALLREKMVEAASDKFVVVADETKLVTGLGGSGLAMPVEVVQFCWKYNQIRLQELFEEEGCEAKLRLDGNGKPYVTDNSNYIVDLYFKTPIKDATAAGKEISSLEGVVEHGLFLDMATAVIIAGKDGVTVTAK
ncbi:hypothetical protein MUK42_17303 [Musa troglodytarum]|uniref:ribose-5-phosphate isomerase n=1 Tax=Musa troglodytarum TaxID=320322 RepID=A0A9E7HGP6_9LILI|nr:hypothetical protein MUK42_17303 [Musa troglodytarum]URE29824.1 hypothetical protein MUK42_17303 [Musa troglodytarum]